MSVLDNTSLEGKAGKGPRLPAIDIARGLAVIAMAVFHTSWDLSMLDLADLGIGGSQGGWALFARTIAATFLAIAGIGLALANGNGIRWPHFLRRLAVICVAAAVITLGTRIAFPNAYIFFGILHNMALSSVIALPFLLLPRVAAALAAPVFLALPFFVSGGLFDLPALAFLGLGRFPPATYDWVPVFPWTGYVLAGIGLSDLVVSLLPTGTGGRIGRGLATLGRYSLIIYLLHQPLIFGALYGLRQVTGPNPAAEAGPFLRNCVQSCRDQDQGEKLCRAACSCTVEALRRDGIFTPIREGRAGDELLQRAGNRAAECLKSSAS